MLVVIVERAVCLLCVCATSYVVDVPTQELGPFSVGQTAFLADVGGWQEIGDICRVI